LGFFHADLHPCNLLVITGSNSEHGGKLCLLDLGLCAEVDLWARNAMTKAIVHLLTKDFDSLVLQDAKELCFLPDDFDTSELVPLY
jgi:predicted unusual protein kinase regulating ubiquinone biosynthesis (AarF/ABC1/UbiB family)